MSWNLFQERAGTKPIFIAVYVSVVTGILFSVAYVYSSFYAGKPIFYPTAASSAPSVLHVDSSHMNQSFKISQPIANNPSLTNNGLLAPQSKKKGVWSRPIWEPPPVGSKMPGPKEFRLTKEMVEFRAKDNIIIVTFGNFAFMDFILNWVKHLTDMGISNLLVGAMDTKLLEALYWKGIPVFDMGSNMNTIDVGWGSPTFHKMGREKVILIDAMLPFGYELLMCDTDMVWLRDASNVATRTPISPATYNSLRKMFSTFWPFVNNLLNHLQNPLPYFARFPEADILTSSDQVIPTVPDDRLEVWQEVSGAYNIGIFHWRPTDSAKKLVKEWKDMLLADDKIWDQTGFNEIVHRSLGPSVDEGSGLFYAYDGNLKLGILPASIFCSGHTYFVQGMHEQLKLETYAVHTTFQYAGTEGKRHRLREGKLFYDQPEYYDSPGGFLSFRPSIPKSLWLDGKHTIESHFTLINHQLKQIRTALAIASLLKRTLVMPPLWCRLDRLWFGHPGVLEGTMTKQPFLCPLDHVFEVNVMLKALPEEEFGPNIDFREYSFLDNPLVPRKVKESLLEVHLCEERSPNCRMANETNKQQILRLPKHSSEEMLTSVFSAYKDVKVIQFSSMVDAFQGFIDKAREAKFRNRVNRYVGIWCCVENRDTGHIYYDMYWDEKPGWKPAPPSTPADDHPPWVGT